MIARLTHGVFQRSPNAAVPWQRWRPFVSSGGRQWAAGASAAPDGPPVRLPHVPDPDPEPERRTREGLHAVLTPRLEPHS